MTRPTDLRQQPGVCPNCDGTKKLHGTNPCRACNGTGQQPAQPESGEAESELIRNLRMWGRPDETDHDDADTRVRRALCDEAADALTAITVERDALRSAIAEPAPDGQGVKSRRQIATDLTDLMARLLHYQEHGEPDMAGWSAAQVMQEAQSIPPRILKRYRYEARFKAQVDRAVARVMEIISREW
jgi:hypothetical protein